MPKCAGEDCRVDLNRHVGGEPAPGDLTVCAHCGLVNVFTEDLQLRPATPEESKDIDIAVIEDFIAYAQAHLRTEH